MMRFFGTSWEKLRTEALTLFADGAAGERLSSWTGRGLAQFIVRVFRAFVANRCPIRAAALAFTTVLALVPMLAVAISVSVGLLKYEGDLIDRWIRQGVRTVAPTVGLQSSKGQDDELERVIKTINEAIGRFRSGSVAGTAVVALIFVAISLISSIEGTLNDIWRVPVGRRWSARIVLYWAAISLGPLVLMSAAGFTTLAQLPTVRKVIEAFAFLSPLVGFALPLVLQGLALTGLYAWLPNTRVRWTSALVGGGVAGLLLTLNSNVNVLYVSRVAQEKNLYGGLAALPLFLLGLYFSWMIVLFGAQVAYVFQYRRTYFGDAKSAGVHQRGREFLALRVMTHLGLRFQQGLEPCRATQLSDQLAVPVSLITEILGILERARLIIPVSRTDGGYSLARPAERISAYDILEAVRVGDGQDCPTTADAWRVVLANEYRAVVAGERRIGEGVSLARLVESVQRSGVTDQPA